jgi:Nif-specific regulatory protein
LTGHSRPHRVGVAGFVMDVPSRPQAALALFLEVSRSFHALVEPDELLLLITERVRTLLDAEACSVILYDPDRGELYIPVSSDARIESPDRLREVRFPASQGIAGWVLREGRSVLVPDVASDPRFYDAVDRQTGTASHSLLCVPLRTRSGTIGVTQAINKRSGVFTPDDLDLLDAIAGNIAVAIENARLHETLKREKERIQGENLALRQAVGEHFRGILGTSPTLRRVLEQAAQAAPTRGTITLLGETGTGKELVARSIHAASDRAAQPFVVVNCAAIPHTLLEAELFGFERGAFTGAVASRRGRFETAHGGTLFLDEIGELALPLQAKLLRVLESGEVQPLGSERARRVDVRIITATNRDLQKLVTAGSFREDLYWRINVITLELPPLRERREDLPLLIHHILGRLEAELGRGHRMGADAEAALLAYDYPGNVREMENILRRAATLAAGPEITLADLPPHVTTRDDHVTPTTNAELKAAKAAAAAAAAHAVERRFLTQLLRDTAGNVSEAARRVGMNRTWLHQLLSRHQIDPKGFQPPASAG